MNGARVGDLFMSLIHSCEVNKVNPFDYLSILFHQFSSSVLLADLLLTREEAFPWSRQSWACPYFCFLIRIYYGIARLSVESSGSRMTYFTTLFF
jgi:hypothetical protein